ncbi:cysteine desulfurase family protein [Candidatus Deianiraea vastatrix]|uniref:Cysteine desulfurase n=1 Tax=Candidatus Deianiraea vastatrix TaxID=2163644 RepID=A0A5B8XD66_9RICK|nr:cysteine desulfurase family protein [Candidatus Deianiraea vastatrix]QED23319.1 Cysteine desulfurase [Candidatus Deianiraea vastatrix]
MAKIYMDYNATTPVLPEILDEMKKFQNLPLNASSTHYYGRMARTVIEDARHGILQAIFPKNHSKYRLIFTSSGTEANNLAINSFSSKTILYSSLEHKSIKKPIMMGKNADKSCEIPVLQNGEIDYIAMENLIKTQAPSLISVMHANNECGVIQNIDKIAEICRNNGLFFHTDASQSFGKIKCNFDEILPDMITISSHKIYGPIGVSALIYKSNVQIIPQILGGGQEFYLRSGTENVAGIYGFSLACKMAISDFPEKYKNIAKMRDEIEKIAVSKGYFTLCQGINRIPNTTMICKNGQNTSMQLMFFDQKGIMVSGGSACSSGLVESSEICQKLGLDTGNSCSQIRFSLGLFTTDDEACFVCENL